MTSHGASNKDGSKLPCNVFVIFKSLASLIDNLQSSPKKVKPETLRKVTEFVHNYTRR